MGRVAIGHVYEAVDTHNDCTVAINVLDPAWCEDSVAIERYRELLRALMRVEHPSLLRIYDDGVAEDGTMFVVLEHARGTTLSHMLASEGALDGARTIGLLRGVAEALDMVHAQGVAHLDLSPSELLYARDGDVETLKLVDFGLAMLRSGISGPRPTAGPEYIAPEVLAGFSADRRADIYSLAAIAWEMLTGAPPPIGGAHNGASQGELATVLSRGLAFDPAKRPLSATALVDDVEDALGLRRSAAAPTPEAYAEYAAPIPLERPRGTPRQRFARTIRLPLGAVPMPAPAPAPVPAPPARPSMDAPDAIVRALPIVVARSPETSAPSPAPAMSWDKRTLRLPGVVMPPPQIHSVAMAPAPVPDIDDLPTLVRSESPLRRTSDFRRVPESVERLEQWQRDPLRAESSWSKTAFRLLACGAVGLALYFAIDPTVFDGDTSSSTPRTRPVYAPRRVNPAAPAPVPAPPRPAQAAQAQAQAQPASAPTLGAPATPAATGALPGAPGSGAPLPAALAAGSAGALAPSPSAPAGAAPAEAPDEPERASGAASSGTEPARTHRTHRSRRANVTNDLIEVPFTSAPRAAAPQAALAAPAPAARPTTTTTTTTQAAAAAAAPPTAASTASDRANDPPQALNRAVELVQVAEDALYHARLSEAIASYRAATSAAPRYASAWRGLGMTADRLGRRDEAVAAMNRYLALSPNAPDAPVVAARVRALTQPAPSGRR